MAKLPGFLLADYPVRKAPVRPPIASVAQSAARDGFKMPKRKGLSLMDVIAAENAQPMGQMKAYAPSLGERLQNKMSDGLNGLGMDRYGANQLAGRTMGAFNDLTPVGNVTGIDDGQREFRAGLNRGDLRTAALGATTMALSMIPFAGGKLAKKAGKGMFGRLLKDEAGAIRAWHGSPHDFDKFEWSPRTRGTGEGAQAYGDGLYFAENRDVAEDYRRVLSAHPAQRYLDANSGNIDWALKDAIRNANSSEGRMFPDIVPVLEAHKAGNPIPASGKLYEVNIDAEPEDFLNWDARFESPDDMERFAARFDSVDPGTRRLLEDWSYDAQRSGRSLPDGNDIFRQLGGIGSDASTRLKEAGLPGIRFLDQGSRGAGSGTSNFVVFDDNLVNILNKF